METRAYFVRVRYLPIGQGRICRWLGCENQATAWATFLVSTFGMFLRSGNSAKPVCLVHAQCCEKASRPSQVKVVAA